jgi:hypothetical protein
MELEQNEMVLLSKSKKLWYQYAPFYLDYYEQLQMGIQLIDFKWLRNKTICNDSWDMYQILIHGKDLNKSFFDYINVLYPKEEVEYKPSSLFQKDGMIKSVQK